MFVCVCVCVCVTIMTFVHIGGEEVEVDLEGEITGSLEPPPMATLVEATTVVEVEVMTGGTERSQASLRLD